MTWRILSPDFSSAASNITGLSTNNGKLCKDSILNTKF